MNWVKELRKPADQGSPFSGDTGAGTLRSIRKTVSGHGGRAFKSADAQTLSQEAA